MKKLVLAAAMIALVAGGSLSEDEPAPAAPTPAAAGGDPVAIIKTTMGEIHVELLRDAAPKTVANFLDLAEGKKTFKDSKTGEQVTRAFYDGLIFHRVIKGFMIQGGCPLGNGKGSPGYAFEDEINAKKLGLDREMVLVNGRPHTWFGMGITRQQFQDTVVPPLNRSLGITNEEEFKRRIKEVQAALEKLTLMKHYENLGYVYSQDLEPRKPLKGFLAMANSGPNTNGSQFFITLDDTPHLTGKHTVFGKVVSGMNVVEAIGQVRVGAEKRPVEDIVIISVRRKPLEEPKPQEPEQE